MINLELLTTAQVAALYGVSTREIARRAATGSLPVAAKLPGVRGAYLFDPKTVAEYTK